MLLLFKVFLLASLVRLMVLHDALNERPLFMAVCYTLGAWFLNALMPPGRPYWALWMLGGFLLTWLYFWLLSRIEDAEVVWWLVLVIGLPLVVI